jgi:DNA polymerase II small subunit
LERQAIVDSFAKADLLVEPAALDAIQALADAPAVVDRCVSHARNANAVVVTARAVAEAVEAREAEQKAAVVEVHAPPSYRPPARDLPAQLRLREDKDVTSKSRCTGAIDDFVQYFRDRYRRQASILKGRVSENGVTTVSAVKAFTRGRNARVIGMVRDKRETKNGHVMLTLEDEEGFADALIPKDSPARKLAGEVVPDEVLALDGYSSDRFFIVKDIVWPDLPIREKRLTQEDFSVAFLSDIHVGSKRFLHEPFEKFLRFLNGEGTKDEQEAAGKIKYLLVAGDLVDGVGVYPEQENELTTKDVYTQYEVLADYLKKIPDYIEVVLAPGNHDAVRLAEPQPAISEEFVKDLRGHRNIHFVGNPGFLDLHGLHAVMYHGCSLVPLISRMPGFTNGFTQPEKVAVELLKRRHLCPVYGDWPLVPEGRDYLVLEEVPDIVHFGHIHHNGYADYRGTTVVNSGAWQSTTTYQLRSGFIPTPGQLPVYNARTGALNVFRFAPEEGRTA